MNEIPWESSTSSNLKEPRNFTTWIEANNGHLKPYLQHGRHPWETKLKNLYFFKIFQRRHLVVFGEDGVRSAVRSSGLMERFTVVKNVEMVVRVWFDGGESGFGVG